MALFVSSTKGLDV